jgi:chaperone required for assembly of F1-ATPase
LKRFYRTASVGKQKGGYVVLLDGRPVKTPLRRVLAVAYEPLAEAIAGEWNAQGAEIDRQTLALTALAQGVIDQIADDRTRIAAQVAAYADSDMLYYRGDLGEPLTEYQAEHWDPLLSWASARYDVHFAPIHGIIHRPQSGVTLAQLSAVVEAQSDYHLAAMLSLVGLTGSLVAVLALVEQAWDADRIWELANLEQLWQERHWGSDEQAAAARLRKYAEYQSALTFLSLVRG